MPTDSIRDAAFCDVLNRELVCALGCTEPIAVAYAGGRWRARRSVANQIIWTLPARATSSRTLRA